MTKSEALKEAGRLAKTNPEVCNRMGVACTNDQWRVIPLGPDAEKPAAIVWSDGGIDYLT